MFLQTGTTRAGCHGNRPSHLGSVSSSRTSGRLHSLPESATYSWTGPSHFSPFVSCLPSSQNSGFMPDRRLASFVWDSFPGGTGIPHIALESIPPALTAKMSDKPRIFHALCTPPPSLSFEPQQHLCVFCFHAVNKAFSYMWLIIWAPAIGPYSENMATAA